MSIMVMRNNDGSIVRAEVANVERLSGKNFRISTAGVSSSAVIFDGDHTEDVGRVLEPDDRGGRWRIVYAHYDPESDRTTCAVTFHTG